MNKFKLFSITLAVLTLVGCQEEFVDSPKPVDGISETLVFSSRDLVDSFLAGMLRRTRAQFTATDTNGINGMYYARTVKGSDIIQRATWFTFDYDNANREPNYRRPTFSWEFPYYMINQANIAIKGINASSLSEDDKNETIAQAMGIRAFYYFQLALEFNATYTSVNSSDPAPPIYTDPVSEGGSMSTIGEMYSLIISDLTTAISNASESRIDNSYINLHVLHGILARVYLTTHDYDLAANHANAARQGFSLNASQYANGMSDMNNDEWIWSMPQSSDQSNYYWGAPHAHADHFVTSYAATFFNTEFTAQFSSTDVRNLFLNGYGVPETDYRARISTKFAFTFDADHPLMRAPEMLLIEAEGHARTGNDSGAADLLFQLQSNRDSSAVASGNTGNALIEEILLERRKELYAELGVEWFDAKRLGRGIARGGNHRLKGASQLTAGDKRFFLKVPQSEIDANPNIDESVNANR